MCERLVRFDIKIFLLLVVAIALFIKPFYGLFFLPLVALVLLLRSGQSVSLKPAVVVPKERAKENLIEMHILLASIGFLKAIVVLFLLGGGLTYNVNKLLYLLIIFGPSFGHGLAAYAIRSRKSWILSLIMSFLTLLVFPPVGFVLGVTMLVQLFKWRREDNSLLS